MKKTLISILALLLIPATGNGALWIHGPENPLPGEPKWSNKAEVADLNGDGWLDILFVNGRGYASPKGGERNQVLINPASSDLPWKDISAEIFGEITDQTRAIKVRDFNGDGKPDIFVANTYQTQSRMFVATGKNTFAEKTAILLPQAQYSFGDAEAGDVDGDGDLDLVLADWGPGNPLANNGGTTRLWLNKGNGIFEDVTDSQMPPIKVKFSWELELADVDNDFDLDILVSCKSCTGSFLFHNDGAGNFTDFSDQLPQFSNNYDFDLMDITGDGFLEAATINDGPGLKEHLFSANSSGGFTNVTSSLWPSEYNVGADDNVVRFIDADSDGDSDLFIGSLSGSDRLLTMDATGIITALSPVTSGPSTPGTLDVIFADFNGDNRLDWVQSQGEIGDENNRIYFGDELPADTAEPRIPLIEYPPLEDDDHIIFRCRIHDGQSSSAFHDGLIANIEINQVESFPLTPYGGSLYRGIVKTEVESFWTFRICATDRAGNVTCSMTYEMGEEEPEEEEPADTVDTENDSMDETITEDSVSEEDAVAREPEQDATETTKDTSSDIEGVEARTEADGTTQLKKDTEQDAGELENEGTDDSMSVLETTESNSDRSVTGEGPDVSNFSDVEAATMPSGQTPILGRSDGEGCNTRGHHSSLIHSMLFLAIYSFSRRSRTSPS